MVQKGLHLELGDSLQRHMLVSTEGEQHGALCLSLRLRVCMQLELCMKVEICGEIFGGWRVCMWVKTHELSSDSGMDHIPAERYVVSGSSAILHCDLVRKHIIKNSYNSMPMNTVCCDSKGKRAIWCNQQDAKVMP